MTDDDNLRAAKDESGGAADPADHQNASGMADDAGEPLEGEIVDEGGPGASGAGPGTSGGGAGPARPSFGMHMSGGGAHPERSRVAFGAVLVIVGVVLLAGRFSDVVAAGSAPLVIGLGFFAWWAVTGRFGLLVPAGVLTGIGGGLALADVVNWGNPVALGLGLGFVAIYLLGVLRRDHPHWWPLVSGALLVAAGLLQNTSGWRLLGDFGWPLLLIVVGVVVLIGAFGRRSARS
jgi:hypothetical protein